MNVCLLYVPSPPHYGVPAPSQTAEDATAPLVCPSIGLQSAIALRAKRWPGPLGLSVRFTLLCNGEETECVTSPTHHPPITHRPSG